MKNAKKKLNLTRETLQNLKPSDVANAVGGKPIDTKGSGKGNTCETAPTQEYTCHVSL